MGAGLDGTDGRSTVRIPDLDRAEAMLQEAGQANPGPWVLHSRRVAQAAQIIAARIPGLDSDIAYRLGLLHDIGRRAGVTGMRHVLDGYRYLAEQGYEDAGQVCMTHSFPNRDAREIFGEWDCSPDELAFIQLYLAQVEYTDYDRLIILCDSLANATGFCLMEARWLDVAFRYGMNAYAIPKWQAIARIKDAFERQMGCSVYSLLPGAVENTFGFARQPGIAQGRTAEDTTGGTMRVFIGGVMQASIQGKGIVSQAYRREIADALRARWPELEIIDPFSLHPNSVEYDDIAAKETLFAMLDHAASSDLLIAFVPTASMGTALEMYRAHQAGVPVITISPLATNWVVNALSRRVFPDLESFLSAVQAAPTPAELS